MTTSPQSKPKIIIRNSVETDIDDLIRICKLVYPGMQAYTSAMLLAQINNFSKGQFLAEYEGRVIGFCSTFIIDEKEILKKHSWKEITGNGYASRHNPKGDMLYGMEVCVDPEFRGQRIGQRLYSERKKLCEKLKLKGIVFGARMADLSKKIKKFKTAENYLQAVIEKKTRDSTISFQTRNGFEILGIIDNYLPRDKDSHGYAVHMIWHNPKYQAELVTSQSISIPKKVVRVATVQYQQRKVESFEQFCDYVEYFIDVVSDYKADFVLFPELFTLQLLSLSDNKLSPVQAIEKLTEYTDRLKKFLVEMAIGYNINIVGGSHPTQDGDDVKNITYVALRDGSLHAQEKIHPTPNEKYWWNIKGGTTSNVIKTDCGPIGVMICYDSEFPELSRHLIDQGALILFVPFCTDERQSYNRVRYCCQARAIENQCYVAMSGNVGNLPGVENMDIQYAQSCILTPCDFPFARDGIAADTTANTEMVAFADLDLEKIVTARISGTVRNLKDRRFDLYSTTWDA
ncbi:MAG: GNAT family N-acetyltransferase [Candidatus Melainabacteria bacterium]|jgi:predicted amidohydrolase/GNAT superfamily N-acetyltransferase|nr:GNAT family N-acetyltransferase [Candidatus Melainabacteria bacterium]